MSIFDVTPSREQVRFFSFASYLPLDVISRQKVFFQSSLPFCWPPCLQAVGVSHSKSEAFSAAARLMVWHMQESAKTVPAGIWLNSDLAARLHLWGGLTCRLWNPHRSNVNSCNCEEFCDLKLLEKKKKKREKQVPFSRIQTAVTEYSPAKLIFYGSMLTSAFWYYISEVYVHVSALLLDIKVHWENNIVFLYLHRSPALYSALCWVWEPRRRKMTGFYRPTYLILDIEI